MPSIDASSASAFCFDQFGKLASAAVSTTEGIVLHLVGLKDNQILLDLLREAGRREQAQRQEKSSGRMHGKGRVFYHDRGHRQKTPAVKVSYRTARRSSVFVKP